MSLVESRAAAQRRFLQTQGQFTEHHVVLSNYKLGKIVINHPPNHHNRPYYMVYCSIIIDGIDHYSFFAQMTSVGVSCSVSLHEILKTSVQRMSTANEPDSVASEKLHCQTTLVSTSKKRKSLSWAYIHNVISCNIHIYVYGVRHIPTLRIISTLPSSSCAVVPNCRDHVSNGCGPIETHPATKANIEPPKSAFVDCHLNAKLLEAKLKIYRKP